MLDNTTPTLPLGCRKSPKLSSGSTHFWPTPARRSCGPCAQQSEAQTVTGLQATRQQQERHSLMIHSSVSLLRFCRISRKYCRRDQQKQKETEAGVQ